MNKNLCSFLLHFINKQKYKFIGLVLLHLCWSIDQTLFPYSFKLFIDSITSFVGDRQNAWDHIKPPIIFGATIWITIEIMYRAYDRLSIYFIPKFEASIREYVFKYVNNHSYDYFSNNFAGSIANKLSDLTSSSSAIINKLTTLYIPTIVALIISGTILAQMHLTFTIIMITWMSIHLGICFYYSKKCNYLSLIHAEAKSDISGNAVDVFSNNLNLRSFFNYKYEDKIFNNLQEQEIEKHQNILKLISNIRIFQAIFCFLFVGVFLTWCIIKYWQLGILSTGDTTYILFSTWNLTMMAWICGIELPVFFKDIGVCNQALKIIQETHEIKDNGNNILNSEKFNIKFENVNFKYKNKNLFNNLNIEIKNKETIGLVGLSGSGKSSFVNLILRFFDKQSGNILINNIDISQYSLESLYKNIAYIPQDPSLFHRSIYENIKYSKIDSSFDEIMTAAKKAKCHDFISKLPEGYHTLVGERGVKLSGGQRQRIAIARAILKNSPILILDEATSALDSITEKEIQDSIKKLIKTKTTLIIAHRLSTLSEVDRIIVFDNGNIIEDGSHDELIKNKGHYYKLWKMQSNGLLPETL